MRSKFLGNTNGELGSERDAPVPFDGGRPAPSCTVNLALKSPAPYWINCTIGVVNSCPSCRCTGTATSRPICELDVCPQAAIVVKIAQTAANHRYARLGIGAMEPSLSLAKFL